MIQTMLDASANDPLSRYVNQPSVSPFRTISRVSASHTPRGCSQDASVLWWYLAIRKVTYAVQLVLMIRTRKAFTVGHGDSLLIR